MVDLMTVHSLLLLLRKQSTAQWGGLVKIGKKATITMMVQSRQVQNPEDPEKGITLFEFQITHGNPNVLAASGTFVTDVIASVDLPAIEEILTGLSQSVWKGVDDGIKRIIRSNEEHEAKLAKDGKKKTKSAKHTKKTTKKSTKKDEVVEEPDDELKRLRDKRASELTLEINK